MPQILTRKLLARWIAAFGISSLSSLLFLLHSYYRLLLVYRVHDENLWDRLSVRVDLWLRAVIAQYLVFPTCVNPRYLKSKVLYMTPVSRGLKCFDFLTLFSCLLSGRFLLLAPLEPAYHKRPPIGYNIKEKKKRCILYIISLRRKTCLKIMSKVYTKRRIPPRNTAMRERKGYMMLR